MRLLTSYDLLVAGGCPESKVLKVGAPGEVVGYEKILAIPNLGVFGETDRVTGLDGALWALKSSVPEQQPQRDRICRKLAAEVSGQLPTGAENLVGSVSWCLVQPDACKTLWGVFLTVAWLKTREKYGIPSGAVLDDGPGKKPGPLPWQKYRKQAWKNLEAQFVANFCSDV